MQAPQCNRRRFYCMVSPFLFLLANESAQGLDIPDIEIVVQYGISRDVPATLQRGSRGGRGSKEALFLIMYEPWVDEIDLLEILFNHDLNPDHSVRYSTCLRTEFDSKANTISARHPNSDTRIKITHRFTDNLTISSPYDSRSTGFPFLSIFFPY